tara:strand:- start:376 stop:831 length:456 start_codon:yes stop_codon:yes gene_type:complete
MYTKKNPRGSFKSNRRSGFRRNNNFSNGKIRNKGNVTQQYNKYLKLAKEAFTSGDRIQSEYYYQFTDHYYRLMAELGLNIEESEVSSENKNDVTIDKQVSDNEVEQEKNSDTVNSEKNSEIATNEEENIESIESIPFIAEPAKKKRLRNSK